MTIRTEKNRIRTLVVDTITLLCKNGLPGNASFAIEGCIGVTSLNDEDDVFLINIKETIKCALEEKLASDSDSDTGNHSTVPVHKKRKRHRTKSKEIDTSRNQEDCNNVPTQVKLEHESSDSGDVITVKEEPPHHRQLHATQVNANETAAINEAVNNSIASLSQIQSFSPIQGVMPPWPPHVPRLPNLPPLPSPQQMQQQKHHQQHQVSPMQVSVIFMFVFYLLHFVPNFPFYVDV